MRKTNVLGNIPQKELQGMSDAKHRALNMLLGERADRRTESQIENRVKDYFDKDIEDTVDIILNAVITDNNIIKFKDGSTKEIPKLSTLGYFLYRKFWFDPEITESDDLLMNAMVTFIMLNQDKTKGFMQLSRKDFIDKVYDFIDSVELSEECINVIVQQGLNLLRNFPELTRGVMQVALTPKKTLI